MVDLKEEQRYRQLRRLAKELHIPMHEAFLELEVRDKAGRLILHHRQRSHSWTRNAYNLLFCELAGKDGDDGTFGAGLLSLKDTSEAIKSGSAPACITYATSVLQYMKSVDSTTAGYRGGVGDATQGIQVGTGTNAESFEDYALQTLIANGTGAGQLSYIASEVHSISYAALTLKNELVRYFNNNSGGGIGVNEVGLVALGSAGSSQTRFMTTRDKLPATVTVPDTGQLKVTYTIQLTYPA
ncbi:hypothetical protein ES705_34687 [subsurface metagenome]